MYSIKIITTNGERALDLKEPSFPYTFESSSVAELTDKSASWSYSISIPRTPNNEQIFGHAGSPFVNSDKPYKRFECNVYANGLIIIRRGVLFLDTATKHEYKVQIVSGFAGVFELMGDVKMGEDIANIITLPLTSLPENGQVMYNPATEVSDNGLLHQDSKDSDLLWYATPCALVGSPTNPNGLLKALLYEVGYTLVTNTNEHNLDSLHISCISRERDSSSEPWIWNTGFRSYGGTKYSIEAKSDKTKLIVRCEYQPCGRGLSSAPGYISPSLAAESYFNAGGDVRFYVNDGDTGRVVGAATISSITQSISPLIYAEIEIENISNLQSVYVQVLTNDEEWVDPIRGYRYKGLPYTDQYQGDYKGYARWDARCYIKDENEDFAYPGHSIVLEKNLGISTGLDLFKMLSQIFAWNVSVDPINKIIYAYEFNRITSRKAQAKDWSDKLTDEDVEIDFDFGKYAQRNFIKLEENKVTNYQDIASFDIEDDTLEKEADAVSIKASSGQGSRIEWWIYNADKDEYKFKKLSKPHLIWQGGSHCSATDIRGSYNSLIQVLTKGVQVLRASFLLNEVDIITFDQYLPIYLRQYGAYFYVNKISDWEAGKLCKVELLKI